MGPKDLIHVKNNSVLKTLFVNCIVKMLENLIAAVTKQYFTHKHKNFGKPIVLDANIVKNVMHLTWKLTNIN